VLSLSRDLLNVVANRLRWRALQLQQMLQLFSQQLQLFWIALAGEELDEFANPSLVFKGAGHVGEIDTTCLREGESEDRFSQPCLSVNRLHQSAAPLHAHFKAVRK